MRKLVSFLCLTLCLWSSSTSYAQQPFSLDGIDYLLFDDGTATVTNISWYWYGNNATIAVPSIIDDNYCVTTFGDGSPVFGLDWHCGYYWGDDSLKWYEDSNFLENSTSELKEIILPDMITKIGKYALAGCNSLTSIEIPGSVNFVDSCAFEGCINLKEVHTHDVREWMAINFVCDSNYRVTSNPLYYAHQLYENNEKITELNIEFSPYNHNIGDYAFAKWDGTKVNLNIGINYIGVGAFNNCFNLESININSYYGDSIRAFCFDGCINLKSVILPRGLKTIGRLSFQNCKSLKSIELPNTITDIEIGAFWLCESLEDINIPQSVNHIGEYAFGRCDSLKSINIPTGLKQISKGTFVYCGSLSSITIPRSVSVIEWTAFNSCSNLKSIIFSDSESKLSYKDNQSIHLNTSDTLLFGKDNIVEEMYIGRNIDETFKESMCNLPKLKTLEFGNCVTEILPNMFSQDAAIEEITFGENIKTIGENVFAGSDLVKTIRVNSTTPADAPLSAFSTNAYKNATLYVPHGAYAIYKNHPTWSNFMNIVEIPSKLNIEIFGCGKVYNNTFGDIVSGTEFEGSIFEFFVLPNDGNVISSITLEGKDIMNDLINHRLTITDFRGEGDGILKIEFAPETEATLVVKGADTHAIRHTYKEGTSAVVELQPEDGWEIHSVTYNGDDVTDKLDNNVFTTAPLHGENNLNMVLVSNSTVEIESVNAADIQVRISINRNTVSITGLDEGELVSVYDVSGKTIYTGFDRSVILKSGESYILTTPSKTFKVAI